MGSTGSHIRDMEEDYEFYCKQLNVIPRGINSIHYDWVEAFYRKETTLTYEEYFRIARKKLLENDLIHLGLKIKELQKKEAELILKISAL